MVDYVKISPLARVGGHLGITARVNSNGAVTNAYAHGESFRGIEKLILKRDPRDAPVITSRTCGKCHFTNRHVALRNIETAAGFSFPFAQAADASYGVNGISSSDVPGYGSPISIDRWHGPGRTTSTGGASGTQMPVVAQLSRNIVQALTYIYSHLVHSVMLVGPDYKNLIDQFVVKFFTGSFSDTTWSNIKSTLSGGPQWASTNEQNTGGFFDNFYKETIVAQRILHEILGFLGGKAPHQMSAIPGGFSRSFEGDSTVTNGDLDAILALATKYIGHGGVNPNSTSDRWQLFDQAGFDYFTNLTNSSDKSWIAERASLFILGLAWAAEQVNAHNWGIGSGNFVCAGAFDICNVSGTTKSSWSVKGDQYFRAGILINTSGAPNGTGRYKLDCTADTPSGNDWMTIHEDITTSRYPEPDPVINDKPQCAGYPGETETHPLIGSSANRYVYTWAKSARVKDINEKLYTVEAGPLARLVVNGVDPHLNLVTSGLRNTLYGNSWSSSTANRLLARLQDMLMCIDILIGTNYSGERNSSGFLAEIRNNFSPNDGGSLLARLDHVLGEYSNAIADDKLYADPTHNWSTMGSTGSPKEGAAFLDAPNGITCHFCKVENGQLTQYQQVAGTTWNGSGRDDYGNPGPVEWSLVGMQKQDTALNFDNTYASTGKYTFNAGNPIVERILRVSYQLREGNNWPTYYAYDEPKYDSLDKGKIVGPGLKETSEIDYNSGNITLEFKSSFEYGYGHIQNVQLDRYGWAANSVPAPARWSDHNYATGYEGFSGSGDTGKPNPINIMRTVRSFDPCNNCGVH